MRIVRNRYKKRSKFVSEIRVELTEAESQAVRDHRLYSFKIQTKPNSLIGTSLFSVGMASAFSAQINRLRNRWTVATSRTTGFVFVDLIAFYLSALRSVILTIFRIFFGLRTRFGKLLVGVKLQAYSIEEIKEQELFVLISIAAVSKAIKYGIDFERMEVFENGAYIEELSGLTFAGAAVMAGSADYTGADVDRLANEIADEFDSSSLSESLGVIDAIGD